MKTGDQTIKAILTQKSTSEHVAGIERQILSIDYYGTRIEKERDAKDQVFLSGVRHKMLLSLQTMVAAAVENSDMTGGF